MDAQQLVGTTAPWVAAGAGLLTAVTALRGAFGARRLRSDVMATSDLLKALPESGASKAREALEDLLCLQAERMRARGRDGVQFNPRQSMIISFGFTLVLTLVALGALAAMSTSKGASESAIVQRALEVSLAIEGVLALFSSLVLMSFTIGGAEAWMKARTKRDTSLKLTTGDRIGFALLSVVFGPRRLIRRVRRRKSDTAPPSAGDSEQMLHATSSGGVLEPPS